MNLVLWFALKLILLRFDLLREKVAVATVDGKAYFLIVSELKEHVIPFVSLVPGQQVPAEVKVVLTTETESFKVKHEKILIVHSEAELEDLILEVKRILLGKETCEKIVIGVDPGAAIGLAVIADGKIIEESNCFSSQELINGILKIIRNVNFAVTGVSVKIGNGVPIYKELLEDLDAALPRQVVLEVVSETGTNKPLKRRSRRIRHISSAIRIAARSGYVVPRRKTIATDRRI